MSEIEIVKLQARRVKGTIHHSITIPKDFIEKLGWSKGNILAVKIIKYKVNGEEYEGLFIFKPEIP